MPGNSRGTGFRFILARSRAAAEPRGLMPRSLACLSLLFAWVCASGALLDVAQGLAWSRMFVGYARTESVAAAARDTFDPGRPCALCRAVSHAREAAPRTLAPGAGAQKLVLICQDTVDYVGTPAPRTWWPLAGPADAWRPEDVPLPPPRALVG
jgi:hypothetical protein